MCKVNVRALRCTLNAWHFITTNKQFFKHTTMSTLQRTGPMYLYVLRMKHCEWSKENSWYCEGFQTIHYLQCVLARTVDSTGVPDAIRVLLQAISATTVSDPEYDYD